MKQQAKEREEELVTLRQERKQMNIKLQMLQELVSTLTTNNHHDIKNTVHQIFSQTSNNESENKTGI